MKENICLICFAMVFTCFARTAEEEYAINTGIDTKVVFKVINDQGDIVSNAFVKAGFYLNGIQGNAVHDYTGTNGLLVAEKKSVGEINYWISKDLHYETSGRFSFIETGVKDGRWQPYGMTNTVVLKRCVNPVAMCVKSNRDGILSPVKNEYVGYDLKKGDWVSPHGKGVVADISIKYEYEAGTVPQLYYRGVVSFAFTNRFDGAYVMKKEAFSTFMSVYNANINNAYQQELIFAYDRLSGKCKEDTRLPDSDYLVLRTRSKRDKDGNLISANYAKIYGPIAAGRGGIYFGFYFNPNENDPNLEADPTKNLLNPNDFGFAP